LKSFEFAKIVEREGSERERDKGREGERGGERGREKGRICKDCRLGLIA
jgi:hypothetical protein